MLEWAKTVDSCESSSRVAIHWLKNWGGGGGNTPLPLPKSTPMCLHTLSQHVPYGYDKDQLGEHGEDG